MANIDSSEFTLLNTFTFYKFLLEGKKPIKNTINFQNHIKTNMGLILLENDFDIFFKNIILLLEELELITYNENTIKVIAKKTENRFRYLLYKNQDLINSDNFKKEIVSYVESEREKKRIKRKGKQEEAPQEKVSKIQLSMF